MPLLAKEGWPRPQEDDACSRLAMSHIFCWTQGALKTTEGKAGVPSLDKEGWLRPLRKCREASLAGADGHERSECEPDRAKQGRVVRSSHRLSEVERTTPSALFKGTEPFT